MHIVPEIFLMTSVLLSALYNGVKCYSKCFFMALILYNHRNLTCSCKNTKNKNNSPNWISCDIAEVSQ